jgi:hypothetical protein
MTQKYVESCKAAQPIKCNIMEGCVNLRLHFKPKLSTLK